MCNRNGNFRIGGKLPKIRLTEIPFLREAQGISPYHSCDTIRRSISAVASEVYVLRTALTCFTVLLFHAGSEAQVSDSLPGSPAPAGRHTR
jgi:hypothetical protein